MYFNLLHCQGISFFIYLYWMRTSTIFRLKRRKELQYRELLGERGTHQPKPCTQGSTSAALVKAASWTTLMSHTDRCTLRHNVIWCITASPARQGLNLGHENWLIRHFFIGNHNTFAAPCCVKVLRGSSRQVLQPATSVLRQHGHARLTQVMTLHQRLWRQN